MLFRSTDLFARFRISLVEFVDSAARFHSLLLAGIERMALRADVDFKDVALLGRAGNELGAACAYALNLVVIGVYLLCHDILSLLSGA